jgi:hypothetical protein
MPPDLPPSTWSNSPACSARSSPPAPEEAASAAARQHIRMRRHHARAPHVQHDVLPSRGTMLHQQFNAHAALSSTIQAQPDDDHASEAWHGTTYTLCTTHKSRTRKAVAAAATAFRSSAHLRLRLSRRSCPPLRQACPGGAHGRTPPGPATRPLLPCLQCT